MEIWEQMEERAKWMFWKKFWEYLEKKDIIGEIRKRFVEESYGGSAPSTRDESQWRLLEKFNGDSKKIPRHVGMRFKDEFDGETKGNSKEIHVIR